MPTRYCNVHAVTGALHADAETEAGLPPLGSAETRVVVDFGPGWEWDALARAFVAPPTQEPTVARPITTLTVLQFKGRFTLAERLRIERATVEHEDADARALLRLIDKDLESTQNKIVDRADLRTQWGVQQLATISFAGAPLLTGERALAIIGADALGGT